MARFRESLWLWGGSTFAALTAAMVGVAGSIDASREHYEFWTGEPMIVAYVAAAPGIVCFLGAVREWPFPFTKGRSRRNSSSDDGGNTSSHNSMPKGADRREGSGISNREIRKIGTVRNYIEVRPQAMQSERRLPGIASNNSTGPSRNNTAGQNVPQGSHRNPSLRVKRITAFGETHEIEIFDLGLAEKWVSSDPWGLGRPTGPIDE
jgi:hypothetical protein